MPIFEYKALNQEGKIVKDRLTAAVESEIAILLKKKNLSPLLIKKIDHQQAIFPFFSRKIHLPLLEKINFCRYLAVIIKAGLPLLEAIELIGQETTDKGMKQIINDLRYQLQTGKALSSALAGYPDFFDEVFLAIINAGEQSGTLEQSFSYLADQLYADYEMRQKTKGMLYYPAVIVATMFAVGSLMMMVVLPRIAEVFLRMNIHLPFYTRVLFNFSLFLQTHRWLFFFIIVFLIVIFGLFLKSKKGRKILIRLFSFLPLFSRFLAEIDLAHFNRLLSTLLNSGVPITDSLRIAASSLTQPKYEKLAGIFEEELSKGQSLSKILKKVKGGFPPLMIRLVVVGEKTGNLEKLLLDLANFYESEVSLSLKNFINLLEPILMLIIGIAVGAMVISIISPIYSILGGLSVQ